MRLSFFCPMVPLSGPPVRSPRFRGPWQRFTCAQAQSNAQVSSALSVSALVAGAFQGRVTAGLAAAMDAPADKSDADGDMRKKIMAIQLDKSLTDAQKAQKRQELMAGRWMVAQADESSDEEEDAGMHRSLPLHGRLLILQHEQCAVVRSCAAPHLEILNAKRHHTSCTWTGAKKKGKAAAANGAETTIFDETLKCAMCMELCNRPITVLA